MALKIRLGSGKPKTGRKADSTDNNVENAENTTQEPKFFSRLRRPAPEAAPLQPEEDTPVPAQASAIKKIIPRIKPLGEKIPENKPDEDILTDTSEIKGSGGEDGQPV